MSVVVLRQRCPCGGPLDKAPASFFCNACRAKRLRGWRGKLLAARALSLTEALEASGMITAARVHRVEAGGVVAVSYDPAALAAVLQKFVELREELDAGE